MDGLLQLAESGRDLLRRHVPLHRGRRVLVLRARRRVPRACARRTSRPPPSSRDRGGRRGARRLHRDRRRPERPLRAGAERRAENEEAAKESQAENIGKQEEEAPLTEGEGAAPDTATGEASSPPEGGRAPLTSTARRCSRTPAAATATRSPTPAPRRQIGPVLDEVLPDMSGGEIRTSIVDPGDTVEKGFPDGVMPTVYGDQSQRGRARHARRLPLERRRQVAPDPLAAPAARRGATLPA